MTKFYILLFPYFLNEIYDHSLTSLGIYAASLGMNCEDFCPTLDLICSPTFADYFMDGTVDPDILNADDCELDEEERAWTQPYHPSLDTSTNKCKGYFEISSNAKCAVPDIPADVKRLCICINEGKFS